MQFSEMEEAEAKFSGIGQIQMEMVPIRRNCWLSFNLSTFICQEISYENALVLCNLPYVLNPFILLKLMHKFMSGVEINNKNISSFVGAMALKTCH